LCVYCNPHPISFGVHPFLLTGSERLSFYDTQIYTNMGIKATLIVKAKKAKLQYKQSFFTYKCNKRKNISSFVQNTTMEDQLLEHIIEKCKQGNRQAQTELYRRYYRGMYSVSLRILNNTAEAEDAMQEAFIAAFGQLKYFRGEVSFGSWLKRIVVNRSIDQLRKRKIKYDDLSKLANSKPENEETSYNETLTPEMVKKAIGKLKDNYRVILSLFLIEGYDHDEIAQILKISNGSSRIIYHRAKEQLKNELIVLKNKLEASNYG
ncbi:MAG TPA: sigma-70 family RNA polymerase sigma factor, partial [Prolixibacteraceae bacterium]|nr:sigma-70 family RNA polymerase sigma factor [Prolixibacteraceae bacterium]